jgi:hypothetical protein
MEEPQPAAKVNIKGWITRIIGALFMAAAIVFFVGAVMLDLVGEKAIGELSNIAEQHPGRSSWTGRMDFTAKTGEQITFYPLTHPTLFDIDPYLRGKTYLDEPDYEVRYLASYPQLAKVKLAFFLEYINHILGLCLGTFMFMIGSALTTTKKRKPLVIDLSGKD